MPSHWPFKKRAKSLNLLVPVSSTTAKRRATGPGGLDSDAVNDRDISPIRFAAPAGPSVTSRVSEFPSVAEQRSVGLPSLPIVPPTDLENHGDRAQAERDDLPKEIHEAHPVASETPVDVSSTEPRVCNIEHPATSTSLVHARVAQAGSDAHHPSVVDIALASQVAVPHSQGNFVNCRVDKLAVMNVGGDNNNNFHFQQHVVIASPEEPTPLPQPIVDVLRANPELVRILGAAITFNLAPTQSWPSVLQICRILQMELQVVIQALIPFASSFSPPTRQMGINGNANSNSPWSASSEINVSRALSQSLLHSTKKPRVVPAKFHEIIARWCLGSSQVSARDIAYTSDHWVFHVCKANHTKELYDALQASWIPTDPVSREKIQSVIDWLEEGPELDVVRNELIQTYKEFAQGPRTVVTVGGILMREF